MIVFITFGHFIIYIVRNAGAVTTDIVHHNVSESVTSINVTGQTGIAHTLTTLYNDTSNWFEARDKCIQLGYKKLEDGPPSWYRWRSAAQAMKAIGLPANLTFWNGIYRPFIKSDSWYRLVDSTCMEVTSELTVEGLSEDERCISGRFTDFYSDPIFTPDVCTNNYPYMCYDWISNVTIHAYHGFTLDSILSNNISVQSNEVVNVSDMECADLCERDIECFAYSYNFISASCEMSVHFDYSNDVDMMMVRTNNNVTFGVKQGIAFSFSQIKTNSSLGSANFTFPECVVDTVPRNYCRCEDDMTEEELQRIVDELVRNLTIDPSKTSKNKQKYTSATDDRVYSRVTGSIAVFIVICFLCVPLLSDIIYLKFILQKFKSNKHILLPSKEELYGYAKTK